MKCCVDAFFQEKAIVLYLIKRLRTDDFMGSNCLIS